MKKILICCFALMLLLGYTHGQEKYDPRAYSMDPAERGAFLKEQTENVKNNAEFVFEGFIQRSDIYTRKDKNGKIYYPVCDIVKITKVFRGNLKPGTVELAGVMGNGFASSSERYTYIPDSTRAIFFCLAAGKDHPYDSKCDIYPVDNKTILMRDDQIVNSTFRLVGDNVFGTMMHRKGDIYRYLRKLPNIKMPKLTKEDTVYVNPWKAVPGESRRLTQVEKDSLMDIYFPERGRILHRADSIRRVKADSIGRIKSDSIALVKKKVQLAVIPKPAVARESLNSVTLATQSSEDYVHIIYAADDDDDFSGTIDLNLTTDKTASLDDDPNIDDDNYVINSEIWTASPSVDPVVSIDQSGNITALRAGSATVKITVNFSYDKVTPGVAYECTYDCNCDEGGENCGTCNGTCYTDPTTTPETGSVEATCTVKVAASTPTSVIVTPSTRSMYVGEVDQAGEENVLTAEVSPTSTTVKWSSNNASVYVDPTTGLLTAISVGNARITAEANDGSGSFGYCDVIVNTAATTDVEITNTDITSSSDDPTQKLQSMDIGPNTYTFTAQVNPDYATDQRVNWQSSDLKTVSIVNSWLDADHISHCTISANAVGKATITAFADDNANHYDDCLVTVVPRIDNIDNATLTAGDGNTITINGQGFGDVQSGSCVSFVSADDGGSTMILPDYDTYDYICPDCDWADDQITMLLPGSVSNSLTKKFNEVGSGDVRVERPSEITACSPTDLKIYHNYLQILDNNGYSFLQKYRLKPSDTVKGKHEITFKLVGNFTPPQKSAIKLAMANWSCELPYIIKLDTISNNKITFGPLPFNTNMETGSSCNYLLVTNGNDIFANNITITINSLITNWDTTLPPDLTTALSVPSSVPNIYYGILHELGHALGLGHVNMEDELMYYKENNAYVLTGNSNAVVDAKTRVVASEGLVDASTGLNWLTTPSPAPDCPAVIPSITSFTGALNANINGVVLNWGDVDKTATFNIKVGTDWSTPTDLANPTVPPYTYTDLIPFASNTYNTYYLTASNDYNTATASTSVSTEVATAVTSSPGNANLTYPPVSSVSNTPGVTYALLYSTSPNGPFANTHATSTVNSDGTVTFTGALAGQGQPYYYEMQVTNAMGGTLTTSAVSFTGCIGASLLANPNNINNVNYPSGTSLVTGSTIATTGTDIVSSGATLNVEAANSIQFSPGFSAKAGSTMDARIITPCSGVQELAKKQDLIAIATPVAPANETTDINVYPNPNNGSFIVSLTNEAASGVSVTSISGQAVEYSTNNNISNSFAITLSNVAKGMYLVKLKGKQKTYVQKVVVE